MARGRAGPGSRPTTPILESGPGVRGVAPGRLPVGRPGRRAPTGTRVVRPEDLLVLTFDRSNLRLETIDGIPL